MLPTSSFSNSSPLAAQRITELALKELPADATEQDKADCVIDVYEGDISIKADIEKIFTDYASVGGIYGVIHIAAHKAVGESAEKPIQYYENNITATINLLDVSSSPVSLVPSFSLPYPPLFDYPLSPLD